MFKIFQKKYAINRRPRFSVFSNKLKLALLCLSSVLILGIVAFCVTKSKNPPEIKPEIIFTEPVSENSNTKTEPEPPSVNSVATNSNTNNTGGTAQSEPKKLDSALIKMTFLSQAPLFNWDALHEDACEEASLIMVYHYYNKTKINSKEQGEEEIQKLVEYENSNGYGLSITLSELSDVAKKYYNMQGGRIINADKESIIAELKAGKPVIAPAAGKVLENPNFKNGGPNYHMLVIKGYDKNGFITNDPGTRKGEGFRYSYQNLLESIHDWNATNILNGEKQCLVFD